MPSSESESCSVVSNSLQPHELYSPWNSPGQNTGVGSRSLLQGIFSTEGSTQVALSKRSINNSSAQKPSESRGEPVEEMGTLCQQAFSTIRLYKKSKDTQFVFHALYGLGRNE